MAIIEYICLAVAILCGLATLLALIPAGSWFIRLCDFPRLQIAVISAGCAAFLLGFGRGHVDVFFGAACLLIAGWQFWHVAKYSTWWHTELPNHTEFSKQQSNGKDSPQQSRPLKLAVVNLQYDNLHKSDCKASLEELDVDCLVLIEVNQEWADMLEPIARKFPHHEGVIREEGLGLMVWSRVPFKNAATRYLVSSNRPSIVADIHCEALEPCRLVALHPTPPGLYDEDCNQRADSRIRDAELILIASEVAAEPNLNWIVTGDFNDVAWSHTTRLFKRLSGLKDPRIGRGQFNTYHAQHPLLRFPIDHVFLSPNAVLHRLGRFHPEGSDHFGMIVDFAFAQRCPNPDPISDIEQADLQDASQLVVEGLQTAALSQMDRA